MPDSVVALNDAQRHGRFYFVLLVLLFYVITTWKNPFSPADLDSINIAASRYRTVAVQYTTGPTQNSGHGNRPLERTFNSSKSLERSSNSSTNSSEMPFNASPKKGINVKTYIIPELTAVVDLQTSGNVRGHCQLDFDCTIWKLADNSSHFKFPVFDAIIGNSRHDLLHADLISSYRDPKQIWIFASQEGGRVGIQLRNCQPIGNQFNWTYWISHKADIVRKHFYLKKRENILSDLEQVWPDKDLKEFEFCWIFSSCSDSLARAETAKLLSRYLDKPLHWWGIVDKEKKCIQPNDTNIEYHGAVPGHYESYYGHKNYIKKCKFYFSFENSYCEDYLTEKFINPLEVGAIPIVNGFRKSYDDHAPPNSFIHVFDFPNMQELAKYLNELIKDESKMLEYHVWRYSYNVEPLNKQPICELCRKVEKAKRAEPGTWIIPDIWKRIEEQQRCIKITVGKTGKNSDEERVETMRKLIQGT